MEEDRKEEGKRGVCHTVSIAGWSILGKNCGSECIEIMDKFGLETGHNPTKN